MEIKLADSYTEHGCNIRGKLAIVEYYSSVTNHNFLGAYQNNGLFDCLEEAKKLVKEAYPGIDLNAKIKLGIPALVVDVSGEDTANV